MSETQSVGSGGNELCVCGGLLGRPSLELWLVCLWVGVLTERVGDQSISQAIKRGVNRYIEEIRLLCDLPDTIV